MPLRTAPTAAPFDVLVLTPPSDGPKALAAVLADLPAELPAAVLIAPIPDEVSLLLEDLGRHTPLPVHWAENGAALQPGHVYVSPPQVVLEVRPDGRCAVTPPEGELASERPQDRLLASLAVSFGERALAVILGGEGRDGLAGARALRGAGGTVLVQDPATADPADLPRAVIGAGAADLVLPLGDLGRTVTNLLAWGHLPLGEARAAGSRSEQRAPVEERGDEAQAFLLRLSDALWPLADPVAVQSEACRLLAEWLDVDRVSWVQVDEAAGVTRVARDWGRGGAGSLAGGHRVSDFGWSVAILRRGEGSAITDTQTSDLVPPQDRSAAAALGIIAWMGAPIIKEGRLVGALCVTASRPRVWQEGEVELLREVGERLWTAVARARAEEALRESERRYRQLFENMGEGFALAEMIWDAEGQPVDWRYLEVNEAWAQTGIPVSETVGRTAREVNPQIEAYWLETYGQVVRTGQPVTFEAYAAGFGKWFESVAFRHSQNRFGLILRDVTARREAGAAVQESEARYRTLFETMGQGCALCELVRDDTGRATDLLLLELNPAYERLMGVRAQEARGRRVCDLFPQVDRRWLENYDRIVRSGQPERLEYRDNDLGGWFEAWVYPQGQDRFVALFEEVTGRKRREANQALLAGIDQDLSRLSGEEEIVRTVGAKLTAHLGLTCYHHVDVDEDRGAVTVRHFWHALDVPSVLGTYPIGGFIPPEGLSRLRAGETSVIHDAGNDLPGDTAATAGLRAGAAAQKIGAYIAVPYSQDGRWKAYFAVADSRARRWTRPEIELIQEVASRVFPRIERARAEQALRASEARYRGLAEAVPMIVWESSDETVDYFNGRWFDYTGLDREAGLGDAWHRVVHPDDVAEAARRSARAARTGQAYEMDYRLRRADGQYRRHLARAARDPGTGRWIGTAVDIHELSEAQAALRASEERFRSFAEHSGDVLWVWNAARQGVEYVSPAVARVWGLAPEQVVADIGALYAVVHPEDRGWASAAMPRVLAGETVTQEYRIVRPDTGEVRWLHDTAFPIRDASGRVHRVGGIAQDITEGKEAEAALRGSEERQAFLLRLSDALRAEPDVDAVANRAIRMLAEQMRLDRCYITFYRPADDRADVPYQVGNGAVSALPDTVRLSDFPDASQQVLGNTVVIEDDFERQGLSEAERRNSRGLGMRALLAATLRRGENNPLGSVVAVCARPRRWTRGEIVLVEEVAERTWAAMERARAEAALRESEERLQQALAAGRAYGFSIDLDTREITPTGDANAALGFAMPLAESERFAMVHPDDLERVGEAFHRALEERSAYRIQHRLIHPETGETVWVQVEAAVFGNGKLVGSVQNITERKRAEEALRKSEEKFRTLFNSIDEGFLIHEMIRDESGQAIDFRLMEVNPAFTRQTGLGNELVGKLNSEYAPGTEKFWLETFNRVARTGTPERVENYHEDTDRWYNVHVSKVGGEEHRIAAVFEDITGRKRREQQQMFLLEFSDHLRTLTDEKTIEETGLQMLTKFLRLNRAYVFVLYPFEDRAVVRAEQRKENLASLLGEVRMSDFPETVRQIEDETLVFHDIDSDTRLSDLNRTSLASVNLQAFVCASIRKGERNVVWSLAAASATPRTWTNDEVELIETVAERTWAAAERARAEEALHASEARFRAVANLVPDLLWESRPDGFATWYNERWLDYTGQTLEQATGWGWTDAIHPEDRELSAQRYGQAASTGQPLRQEHRIRRHDGEYRWFVVNTFPVQNERGEVFRVYGAATDIHHLRSLNAALEERVAERTRRLTDLNAELGNVITRTAHNLEAPARRLGDLLAPGRPLDSGALDGLPPYDPVALHDEVTRLRGIAQDLRQLAQLEQQDVTKDLLPLGELFGEVRAQVSTTPRGARVHWLMQPLPIVRGDRALLKQALEVLMTFTLSETRGAQYVTVSSREVEGEVQVTVEDDGIGLTGEEAATLFDLAVRTDQQVPVLPGSGLVQVRRILARHGGWAWAEAQLGGGKVVLAFPRDEAVNELEALFRQD